MNKLRFMHFRRPRIELARDGVFLGKFAANGGITAAYTEHEENGVRYLKCAFARCNRTDHYNNRIGREYSERRWTSGEVHHTILTSKGTYHTLLQLILDHPLMYKNLAVEVRASPYLEKEVEL